MTPEQQLEAAAAKLLDGMDLHVRVLMADALSTEALGLLRLAADALDKHGAQGRYLSFEFCGECFRDPHVVVGNHRITPDFAVRYDWKIIGTFATFDEAYRVALEVTA